jgi:hypothetical protein
MNNNYDAVYRNTGTTPRKMHRVEDHYAIHTFKSDTEKGIKFFIDMVVGILMVGLPLVALYSFISWLDMYK